MDNQMRILKIVALCAVLGGCAGAAQPQAGAASHDGQFIGQNVTSFAAQYGPPTSSKRMDDGQGSYVWQLDTVSAPDRWVDTGPGGLYGDGHTPGYISDDPRFCKVKIITSPDGIITQFNTEDSNGTGAPAMTLGINGSVCAKRLRTQPQT
jgi:hypothetical protein